MSKESAQVEKEDNAEEVKITLMEKAYLFIIMISCIFLASVGFYWIISDESELPTGPAMMVVGSLMSGITIIKFAAERKRALNPESLVKAVTGLETQIGIGIAVLGLAWHLGSKMM